MATKAQLEASKRYDEKNTTSIHLKLNRKTDADVLLRLEQVSGCPGGKQGYIKALIRADIKKN